MKINIDGKKTIPKKHGKQSNHPEQPGFRGSNFMRSKVFWSGDWIILSLFRRLKVAKIIQSPEKSVSHKYNQEIESCKSIICNFWSPEKIVSCKYDHEIESI